MTTPNAASMSGDSYVIVRGGLVVNDPALPVFDLDVLDTEFPFPDDAEYARERARLARSLGLTGIAAELDGFAASIDGGDDGR